MKVETFECEETVAEHVECSDEAIKLIESLGLSGQQKLLARSDEGQQVRCPYRKATKDELTVYGLLCPTHYKLDEYAEAPMPLRVLQVVAHAQALNFFDRLVVWAAASSDVKDPVLLGLRSVPNSPGSPYKTDETYLLARWGEALDEWPAMVKAAQAKWKDKVRGKIGDFEESAAKYRQKLECDPSLSQMGEYLY